MRYSYVVSSLLLLFGISFIDAGRGPLLPWLQRLYGLSYQIAGLFLVVGNVFAIFSTLALIPLLRRHGEKRIAGLAIFLSALAIGSTFAVQGTLTLLASGALLGSAIAAIGGLVNVLMIRGTSVDVRGRFLCALHAMYGFASLLAPLVIARAEQSGAQWCSALTLSLVPFSVSSILLIRDRGSVTVSADVQERLVVTRRELAMCGLFAVYVAGEVLTSMWMAAFLVGERGMPLEIAANYVTGFFLVMTITRLLCFFHLPQTWERWLMLLSITASGLFVLAGIHGNPIYLCLSGCLGPFFPLMMAWNSRIFHRTSDSMAVLAQTSMQVGLLTCHFSTGKLADLLGIGRAYLLSPSFLFLTLLIAIWMGRRAEFRVTVPLSN